MRIFLIPLYISLMILGIFNIIGSFIGSSPFFRIFFTIDVVIFVIGAICSLILLIIDKIRNNDYSDNVYDYKVINKKELVIFIVFMSLNSTFNSFIILRNELLNHTDIITAIIFLFPLIILIIFSLFRLRSIKATYINELDVALAPKKRRKVFKIFSSLILFLMISLLLLTTPRVPPITPLELIDESGLPILIFQTNCGGSLNRENWRDASLSISNAGEYDLDEVDIQVRGRGNSTWRRPKRPFRFRFPADAPLGVLGLDEARDFVLLANAMDNTHLRNHLSYSLARNLNPDAFNPSSIFVEVFFNDDFLGLYLLTEQMEVHENRLDIELTDDLNTGFFLEMCRRAPDGEANWFWANMGTDRKPVEVRAPSNISQEQIDHVQGIFNNFNQTLVQNEPFNLEDYINVDSFISFFMVQEIFMDVDINMSSSLMFVDNNGIIHMGPTWDMDLTLDNLYNRFSWRPIVNNGEFHAKNHAWMYYLLQNKYFVDAFANRVDELTEENFFEETFSSSVMEYYYNKLYNPACRNARRWALIGKRNWRLNPNFNFWSINSWHTTLIFYCFRDQRVVRNDLTYRRVVDNLFYGINLRISFLQESLPNLLDSLYD